MQRAWIRSNDADAIADFSKAIELDPDNKSLYEYRAERRVQNDPDGAFADYTIALNRSLKNRIGSIGRLYDELGAIRQYKNDLQGAIEDYNKAIQAGDYSEFKTESTPYYHRGIVTRLTGDLKGALDDFQRYANSYILPYGHADDTNVHDDVHIDIWVLETKLGNRDDADRQLSTYLDMRRKRLPPYDHCASRFDPDTYGYSIIAEYLLGKISETEFLSSWHEGGYYYVGMKHLFSGDKKIAIEYFHKIMELPNSACPYNDSNREFSKAELSLLEHK